MDEKDQKTLTIDDILNQLTKPSILRGQGQDTSPSSHFPSASFSPSVSQKDKLPPLSRVDESQVPTPGSSPKEAIPQLLRESGGIQLSIRTLSGDLIRLRQGQKPKGIEIRKVLKEEPPVINKETLLGEAAQPASPSVPKATAPGFKLFTLPSLGPVVPEQKAEIKTPEFPILKENLPPLREEAVRILPPDLPPLDKYKVSIQKKPGILTESQGKVEYKIIAKVISSGLTTGIVSTVLIALAVYFLLSFFVFNQEEVAVVTPTPIPSKTIRAPRANELEAIFGGIASFNFIIPARKEDFIPSFYSSINNAVILQKEFKKITFTQGPGQEDPRIAKITELLDRIGVSYPAGLRDVTGENYLVLLYGQHETFNEEGQLVTDSPLVKRLVFITEIKDLSGAAELLRSWEVHLPSDVKDLFDLNLAEEASKTFIDNDHGGISIRYKNFPFPDKSVDYAIVPFLSGQAYLVITNSREAMYSPVDKIRGL